MEIKIISISSTLKTVGDLRSLLFGYIDEVEISIKIEGNKLVIEFVEDKKEQKGNG